MDLYVESKWETLTRWKNLEQKTTLMKCSTVVPTSKYVVFKTVAVSTIVMSKALKNLLEVVGFLRLVIESVPKKIVCLPQ